MCIWYHNWSYFQTKTTHRVVFVCHCSKGSKLREENAAVPAFLAAGSEPRVWPRESQADRRLRGEPLHHPKRKPPRRWFFVWPLSKGSKLREENAAVRVFSSPGSAARVAPSETLARGCTVSPLHPATISHQSNTISLGCFYASNTKTPRLWRFWYAYFTRNVGDALPMRKMF